MKVVCSYCRGSMGEKEPLADERVTHSVCGPCDEHFERQWSGLDLTSYLEGLPVPVAIVDPEGRILAASASLGSMLEREPSELRGLLGGEVFECVYARLPEGCGRTVHCPACTVRRAVMHTLSTGATMYDVSAHIERDEGRLGVRLTTERLPMGVRLRISPG